MTDWYRGMRHHIPEGSTNWKASLTGWAVTGHHLNGQQGRGVQDLTSSGPLSLGFPGLKHVASASSPRPLFPAPGQDTAAKLCAWGCSSPCTPHILHPKTQEQTRPIGGVELLLLGRAPQAHPWSG